jgi:hypothetical protein
MELASRLRFAFLALVAAATVAIAVDRIALYVWASSVLHQFHRYRLAETAAPTGPERSLTEVTEPPLWISAYRADRAGQPTPAPPLDLLLALEPSFARPNFISVKGYEVSLIYLPPALAWTTRLFPLRPHGLQYAYYRPQEHYGYEVLANFAARNGLPHFTLYRRTNDCRRELPPDTRSFEWFP